MTVEYLDYTNGDDQINTAIEGWTGTGYRSGRMERLVANLGAKGLMVDLADLWTQTKQKAIYPSVEAACKSNGGVYYEYPLYDCSYHGDRQGHLRGCRRYAVH